jgi:hypothetical protein
MYALKCRCAEDADRRHGLVLATQVVDENPHPRVVKDQRELPHPASDTQRDVDHENNKPFERRYMPVGKGGAVARVGGDLNRRKLVLKTVGAMEN